MSEKIRAQHLERKAILYVRQSSAYQVTHNLESQKLQYAMEERLRQLGWREIEVVDEDLGRWPPARWRGAGSSAWWPRSASARWAPSPPARSPALLATVGSGNNWWRSAAWWTRFSSTKKRCMLPGKATTVCCWG